MNYHALRDSSITAMELKNQEAVRRFAGECAVVLENDGTLPVNKNSKIALFGNGATRTIKGGTGSGDVNSRYVVNIADGLEQTGFEVTTKDWLKRFDEAYDKHQAAYIEHIAQVAAERNMPQVMVMFDEPISPITLPEITDEDIKASEGSIGVYVVARDSGEGGDRHFKQGDYLFNDDEIDTIKKMTEIYDKTIVLLNVGGIVNIQSIKDIEGVNAIVLVSQLGNITGLIVGDILNGDADPSGRLTDTWAKRYEDYPCWQDFSHNNGNTDDEYYNEGIYIGYRYFDAFGVEPAYCFGYGLGYTTFEMKTTAASIEGDKITVKVNVKNTGSRAGKEVVQVYVTAPEGKITKPVQELKGFKKTETLKPGEETTVEVEIDIKSLAVYDVESASRILEAGSYIVRVGKNIKDTEAAACFTVEEDIVTEKLKNICAEVSAEEDRILKEIEAPKRDSKYNEIPESAIVMAFDGSAIETRVVEYLDEHKTLPKAEGEFLTFDDVLSGKATVEDLVSQLTVEEMAKLCVGSYAAGEIEDNIIGSASLGVPGAAAETVDFLMETRKIPSLILADGPAGLRLQPHFKADAKTGKLLRGGEVFGLSFNPFPEDTPEDAIDYYQYCTAVPIATALAQSWNMDLVYEVGSIVGEEMKQFYVHFWLAPGMNIHRNPLCGRNFEYYSEDPLIAGKCAAADTLGVQSYGAQGTTIKHFACNNQEDNRMYSNSHVSEKALRELYLKGFEIAIKESQPYSIMTSYNLLNGTHTANHYDLLQVAARDEWGFEGVVMTDWFTSQESSYMGENQCKYKCSASVECIRAGNDWQMPGCEKNVTDIIDAIEAGTLPVGDLQFCTCNIIRMAAKCFS